MQKIGNITETADANGEFTNGNVAQGVVPTILMAEIFNTWQRELVNIVTGTGNSLDPKDDTQLLRCLKRTFLMGPLVMTTGTSETEVMSQKAVTDALGQNASIGVNQLWNDVTAQRNVGVNYTNSTGRPMMIVLDVRNVPPGLTASIVYVQGIAFSAGAGTNGEHRFITVVVPPGQQYRYDPVATSNFSLLELR